MPLPAFAVPGAMDAPMALDQAVGATGLSARTGSWSTSAPASSTGAACAQSSSADRQGPRRDRRAHLDAAGLARHAVFDPAERAALALGEAMTRMADHGDGVPDDVWEQAASHYDEQQLAALVVTIANVNL